ncbi:hypothetical protein GPJ56_008377 [Histomonas meleagridis]|uniref:uncharacterized protein n=1 Tax=Histomonas meleagridis TaxID=135588 RepID=UPI003559452A|nr:hypothetical protein GPJ56_008377 [Histomonas meleagridis]KAH0798913.1 hypothetical protein GO595_008304 [Histomonas meleagridis]
MNSADHSDQIIYWKGQLEELRGSYMQMLSNTNPLYAEQLSQLQQNHEIKLHVIKQKYESAKELIEKDVDNQINVLKEELPDVKDYTKNLLQRTIQQQVDDLRKEFPEVFSYLMQLDIPFINEFTKDSDIDPITLTLNEGPLLSPKRIQKDIEKSHQIELYHFDNTNGMTNGTVSYQIGSTIVLKFGSAHPVSGVVTNLEPNFFEFQQSSASSSINITYEALNSRIVTVVNK